MKKIFTHVFEPIGSNSDERRPLRCKGVIIIMLNNIFDSHCHYDDYKFKYDYDDVIKNALNSTVVGMIHASTDLESADFGIKMSDKFKGFYTSVGFHPDPNCIVKAESDYIEKLRNLVQKEREKGKNKIIAIGEIGLDYHYEDYDKARQIEVFTQQIELANELSLPVIVHLRDAIEDGMNILNQLKPKGVIHCFSGSAETAKEVLNIGMYISFTGALTFKNAKKANKALEIIPINKLLLETDCPYMAPEPYRGQRCDSTMISEIAKKVADSKGLSPQEVLDITTNNVCELFNIVL